MSKAFKYKVNLVPLKIDNQEPDIFRNSLNDIPYLLYEVEQIKTGEKIVINKPGGKRNNYNQLSRDDFMVFIHNTVEETLWLISHDEILKDLELKHSHNEMLTKSLINGLYNVCNGMEPDDVIEQLTLSDTVGISVEILLKTYKWIWGQEDCNYPTKKGRWLSMDNIINHFNCSVENFE